MLKTCRKKFIQSFLNWYYKSHVYEFSFVPPCPVILQIKRDSFSLQRRQTMCFLCKGSLVDLLLNIHSSSATWSRQPQQGLKYYQNKFFSHPCSGLSLPITLSWGTVSPTGKAVLAASTPCSSAMGHGAGNYLSQGCGHTSKLLITYAKVHGDYQLEYVYEHCG